MPAQQGIEGPDGRFLRRDGTVPLSAGWNAALNIIVSYLQADLGGRIVLGDIGGSLRLVNQANEIMELLGVSNNQANLYLKNLRVGDLAGVGNRNVIADVNGDLSAP